MIPPPPPVHRNISHGAHFIATFLTFGLWAPLWALAAMNTSRINNNMNERYARELAEYNRHMLLALKSPRDPS